MNAFCLPTNPKKLTTKERAKRIDKTDMHSYDKSITTLTAKKNCLMSYLEVTKMHLNSDTTQD
jgi:hypothetical protein